MNILLIAVVILFSLPSFSIDANTERKLAYKYCRSIESNMFKGLDDERILKYEYFFNSVNKDNAIKKAEFINNFISEVDNICSYNLKSEETEDFIKELNKYLSNN